MRLPILLLAGATIAGCASVVPSLEAARARVDEAVAQIQVEQERAAKAGRLLFCGQPADLLLREHGGDQNWLDGFMAVCAPSGGRLKALPE